MIRLVESFATDGASAVFDGQSLPTPCLVEDDDGLRWYLTDHPADVNIHYWTRAVASGASALLCPQPGGGYLAQTVETFMDTRREEGLTYRATADWVEFPSMPSYLDLLARLDPGEQMMQAMERAPFVHLHTHSEYSLLDGLSTMTEIADVVKEQGGFAFGVADHGHCAGHPEQQKVCDKAGLKPIFAMETYLVEDRFLRLDQFVLPEGVEEKSDQGRALRAEFVARLQDYYHLVLIAVTTEGLHNLWAMSTEAYRDGMYSKNARLDWDTLSRYSEGVIATTGCLRGPLTHNGLLDGDEEAALQRLGRLMAIFGERLYVEIHCNSLPQQVKVNADLVRIARQYNVPMVAAVDAHYAYANQREPHRVWLSVATDKDVGDETTLFGGDQDYHLKTEDEVRWALDYLPPDVVDEAVVNTALIARMCTARITVETVMPVFSAKGDTQADVDRLLDLCMDNWGKTKGKRYGQQVYLDRFEHEFPLLVRKRFCGYYLMTAEQTSHAKEHGILVGPGRGSGGGSLVAYLAGITDIDPVDADLLFERFMTEDRVALPDFDVDYPASRKGDIQQHVLDRYGEDHAAVVGSVMRLQSKGIINKLGSAMKSTLPESFWVDKNTMTKIIDEAEGDMAGLGLSWEALWVKAGDQLQPYRDRYPHLFAMADVLVGRVNTFGQHASGMVITTDAALTKQLPMRRASEETHLVVQWDKDVLEELGFVKWDLLTLRTLDTIQDCIDLIKKNRGHTVDVYSWRDEYLDPEVWEEIANAHTLGIFQIETTLGTRYAKRMHPQNLADLADLVTIVRPGPRNSGLTETYLRRRDGLESVSFPDPRMEHVLAKTYGTLLYQEDIMQACMVLAGYNGTEADEVRKILGHKKVELVAAAGIEFIDRAVVGGMDRSDAATLWSQMAEFAKYCVTGDTEVWLAARNAHTSTLNVGLGYRRLHTPLRDPVVGRTKAGEEFAGPCDACGSTESGGWTRGRCRACYVWLQKFHDPDRGVQALSWWADGRIRPARILDVLYQGAGEVFRLTLADGKQIRATARHKMMTAEGYKRLGDLVVGDRIIVDGGYQMPTPQESSSRNRLSRGAPRHEGVVNGAFGEANYAYIDGGTGVWQAWRDATPKVCVQCGTADGRIEQAHLNGDHQDQRWENYAWLCSSCHLRYDYAVNDRRRRWQKGHVSEGVAVWSIEYAGVEDVYDLVMEEPHNFVANGMVISNSFGRAHAFAYAVLGYWAAWLKFHYPVEFLVSALSSVDKDRIPDFVKEARRMGYSVLPPDINESGHGFKAGPLSVRYGLDAIKGVAGAAQHIEAAQPFTSFEDFMTRVVEPTGSKVNRGHVAVLAKIGAFDALVPNRRGLEQMLLADKTGDATRCVFKQDTIPVGAPNDLPCVFDWDSEPMPINPRTGKKLPKQKPIPKRCTIRCRQYVAPEPVEVAQVEPYTDVDIRTIEQELLGVFLSSTPFDVLPPDERAITLQQAEMAAHETAAEGLFLVAGILTKKRPHTSKAGQEMGFIALDTEVSTIDAVVFEKAWLKYKGVLKVGSFYVAEVEKNSRGFNLYSLMLVNP